MAIRVEIICTANDKYHVWTRIMPFGIFWPYSVSQLGLYHQINRFTTHTHELLILKTGHSIYSLLSFGWAEWSSAPRPSKNPVTNSGSVGWLAAFNLFIFAFIQMWFHIVIHVPTCLNTSTRAESPFSKVALQSIPPTRFCPPPPTLQ